MRFKVEDRTLEILEKAQEGKGLTREECIYLLRFEGSSPESSLMRAVANDFTRRRLNNAGVVIGQIGVDIGPCAGGCKFCVFAEQHTKFDKFRITEEELVQKIEDLSRYDDLYGLFLMTMHVYDIDMLLNMIDVAKKDVVSEDAALDQCWGYGHRYGDQTEEGRGSRCLSCL